MLGVSAGAKGVPCPLSAGAGGREEEDGVLRGEGVEPSAVALREEVEDLRQGVQQCNEYRHMQKILFGASLPSANPIHSIYRTTALPFLLPFHLARPLPLL